MASNIIQQVDQVSTTTADNLEGYHGSSAAADQQNQGDYGIHGTSSSSVSNAGLTLWMAAVVGGDLKVVANMVRCNQISVNIADQSGHTGLMYASMNGNVPMVRALIQHGARVNDQHYLSGDTALHMAALSGHTHTVRVLLEHGGADKRLVNGRGETAYDCADKGGHGKNQVMIRLLMIGGGGQDHAALGHSSAAAGAGHGQHRNHAAIGANGQHHSIKHQHRSSHHGHGQHGHSVAASAHHRSSLANRLPSKELLDRLSFSAFYQMLSSGMGVERLASKHGVAEPTQENGLVESSPLSAPLNYHAIMMEMADTLQVASAQQLYHALLDVYRQYACEDGLIGSIRTELAPLSQHHVSSSSSSRPFSNRHAVNVERDARAVHDWLEWKAAQQRSIGELIVLFKKFDFYQPELLDQLAVVDVDGGNPFNGGSFTGRSSQVHSVR